MKTITLDLSFEEDIDDMLEEDIEEEFYIDSSELDDDYIEENLIDVEDIEKIIQHIKEQEYDDEIKSEILENLELIKSTIRKTIE